MPAAPTAADFVPRVDPESRDVDYAMRAADGANVKNCRTDMHYVLVAKDGHMAATYRALGYRKVPRTKDGPYIFADDDDDALAASHVEYMGHVLMAIPKAKYDEIQQQGHPTGALGLKAFDEIERQIVRNGAHDLMRGQIGKGLTVTPGTSALHREER